MGSPPAPAYTTLHFGLHEQKFLRKHKQSLFFYRRFIDDVIGIWINKESNRNNNGISSDEDSTSTNDNNELLWDQFIVNLNGATGLTWEINNQATTVDFMDLTISICDNRISTTLFEKQSNRHLYIPPHSLHPPGVINGVVHGMIHWIYTLCSDESDRKKRVRAFFNHLQVRGYTKEAILPILHVAITRARAIASAAGAGTAPESEPDPNTDATRVFLHLPYHPDCPQSRDVQRAWKQRVSHPKQMRRMKNITNHMNIPIGIERLTVAYHRSHNLGNLLSYCDMKKRNGPAVLSYFNG